MNAVPFRRETSEKGFHYEESLSLHYIEQDKDYICSRPDDNGMHTCNNLPHYKIGEMICNDSAVPNSLNMPTNTSCVNWNQYYTECKSQGSNPFQGTISFDNIGLAWVAIFLVISLEGWTDIMYYVQDAHSFWDWIYFVLLIVIGSFFMINLCLVVIATQFSETKKREMERMRLERARFHSTSTLASSTNNSEPTTCYAEIVKYIAHLWRRTKRRLLKKYRVYRYRRQHEQDRKLIISQNLPEPIGISSSRFSMQFCGGHDRSGENPGGSSSTCSLARHSCRYHSLKSKHQLQAPHASPEVSEIDVPATPRGLLVGNVNSGSLLRVPSTTNTWNEKINEGSWSGSSFLSPPSVSEQRRRSSVMFCDEVTTLNSVSEEKNICSSEKMTQTDDGDIWQHNKTNANDTQSGTDIAIPEISNEALTCQELLAFSGAISAALPTGQLALESIFTSLTKGVQEKNEGGNGGSGPGSHRWPEPGDTCSCCGETSGGDCPICTSPEWSIVMNAQKDGVMNKQRHRTRLKAIGTECGKCTIYCLTNLQRFVKALVEHKYFQQGILLAILFNTLSMGIEYHNQPEELTVIVEISNIVFSGIFAVEMLLKVIAEGPFGYISNGFNVFDGVIVILSIIELCQTFLDGSGNDRAGSSGLSVLRTFRLLRILKLVRFMPNLRRQLFVMLRTMDNVAVFFSLLILFIFIFSFTLVIYCTDILFSAHNYCLLPLPIDEADDQGPCGSHVPDVLKK
ncbi:hypothetical protein RUM44_011214 [Polyplax serrata]|uniref:Ion transport domain-containing protein n=1 Tax=Polyplax serrata TaxID=468196 RepID=A0ABR1APD6_POLSC